MATHTKLFATQNLVAIHRSINDVVCMYILCVYLSTRTTALRCSRYTAVYINQRQVGKGEYNHVFRVILSTRVLFTFISYVMYPSLFFSRSLFNLIIEKIHTYVFRFWIGTTIKTLFALSVATLVQAYNVLENKANDNILIVTLGAIYVRS